jgi:hypothetical protein
MKKKFDVDKWFDPSKELKKASELVRFFRMDINLDTETSKKCALKIADEIIKQSWDYREIDLGANYDYWTKVKHEIEQL